MADPAAIARLNNPQVFKNEHQRGMLPLLDFSQANINFDFSGLTLGSGLIDYSQKMTMAAMQIADMNV